MRGSKIEAFSMDGGAALPSWARAAEPLVPGANVSAVVKEVRKALKEIQKASDEIARLARRRAGREIGQQLLTLSTATRERARETSQTLRQAFATAEDGSADHATLTALSEEFKATLRRFQQVWAASSSTDPRPFVLALLSCTAKWPLLCSYPQFHTPLAAGFPPLDTPLLAPPPHRRPSLQRRPPRLRRWGPARRLRPCTPWSTSSVPQWSTSSLPSAIIAARRRGAASRISRR